VKEVVSGSGIPKSSLPFSPAIRAGGFVFLAGQASVDDKGTIVSDTFEGEMRRSLENVGRILEAAGLAFADVVQVRGYVRDPADLPKYNEVYREFFSEPYPARTTLTCCLPETLRFEVEVVAYDPR